MKKKGILLLVMSLILALSGITVNAAGVNAYDNPAPVEITDDSVLVLREEDGYKFELKVLKQLGYQEIVFPHGTDLSTMEFMFDVEQLNFNISADVLEAHEIDPAKLTVNKGYYHYLKEDALSDNVYCSKDGGEYERVPSWDPLVLEDGAKYTVSIDGEYGAYEKIEGSVGDSYRHFEISQGRKFAFQVRIAGPEVLEGESHEVVKGTAKECVIRVNKDFSAFEGVKCNDKLLEKGTDYTAKSGSTVITLTPDYVKALEIGEYTIKAIFNDCESEPAIIKVIPAENEEDIKDDNEEKVKSPQTGDYSSVSLWLFAMACVALLLAVFTSRQRNR